MRPETAAMIALGLLALVIPRGSPGVVTSSGRIARLRTAPPTRSAWIRTRLAAARAALTGLVSEGSRESIARDIVAHWMREVGPQDTTARGATDEFNYNIGNIIAPTSWHGSYYVTSSGQRWKAFPSLPAAVANYVALISTAQRYAASWAQLLAAPDDVAEWNAQLVAAGYEAASSANLAQVRSEMPQFRNAIDAWVASNG